ncbi:MAG: hypothetical protein UR28_C0039G0018 [Candidatus Peregrinibacteria bacterium GW2011_GWF2_33_10]|nr:MAG: hypothetical protein UR28_C0039G0018 [Candidatus Peregrinibacteria bacterium GW2011_GWF2_33_10]OGJ44512.1 MAG: hypothetical protein A2263_05680 [Candidatus Peregrinibacteria bacterium RIFOXYA2_FULL_33_21]OGJ46748.1 MAG: hypothetical protein A2272_03615 [Candidatus Peregrinibacteria bacterium RIFOXYA12_FULL_33_12]OGJ50320.1 MAG: hypothetical protein A2307_06260 [Candidatus Peregrinibacteria bacterium RIFOXYB2_FULL_33_20]
MKKTNPKSNMLTKKLFLEHMNKFNKHFDNIYNELEKNDFEWTSLKDWIKKQEGKNDFPKFS